MADVEVLSDALPDTLVVADGLGSPGFGARVSFARTQGRYCRCEGTGGVLERSPHVGWRFTSSVCIGYPSNGLCAWMSAIFIRRYSF